MTKGARLNEIIKCCEKRFNRGDAATWKHGDFVDLSREIQRDTNTNISPSTLKRIFGKVSVDDDYIPQQATFDALKKYGRYEEPKAIEPENLNPAQQPEPLPELLPELLPIAQPPQTKANDVLKRWRVVLFFMAIIAVTGTVITWQLSKPKSFTGNIQLARTEGQLPATAFFELQLPETEDSLFVNFGDKSPLKYVKPGEKTAAHIYYIPGVFTVTFQTRQQSIDTTTAYIRSYKWIGMGFHNQGFIPNHFFIFPAVKTGSDSLFQFSNMQLAKMGLDTNGVILTRLCNYTPVDHHTDDFIFETTFKNTVHEIGNYCRSTQFQISGSKGMIRFKLVSPGCSLRVLNILSEQTFNGATVDLSAFVLDLNNWNKVKLINRNKQVSLFVNGKQIFSGTYDRPLGDISGVFLEFEGTGYVKTCELKSNAGKMLYQF